MEKSNALSSDRKFDWFIYFPPGYQYLGHSYGHSDSAKN